MVPSNFVGLALFVAFVTPGYVWIRLAEQRRPRPGRSQLLEAAELLAIGAVFTITASALVVAAGKQTGLFLDVAAWLQAPEPAKYLVEHSAQVVVSLVGAMLLGNSLAWGAAQVPSSRVARAWRERSKRSRPARGALRVGTAVWYDLFGDVDISKDRVAISAVQTDGTRIEGYLQSYDYSTEGREADLALQKPIVSISSAGHRHASAAAYVWLPGRSLSAVYALIEPDQPMAPSDPESGDGGP